MFRFFDHFNPGHDDEDSEMGHHGRKRKHFADKFRSRGPFGHDFGESGRKRQRRGDIKFILLELIKEQPRHGYELIKVLEERYGGFYRPSPGTVYPTLQLLEDEGNLTSETVDGKRTYKITSAGEKLLEEQQQNFGHEWPSMPGFARNFEQRADLRHSVAALFESIMQAGRYGSPEQVKAVQDLLNKTNQEVHQILAGGNTSNKV